MKRGLFIFFGEAFRQGQNESRLRDTAFGLHNQEEASKSHNELINYLESLGWSIDIAINTYTTIFQEQLLSWYKNTVYTHFSNQNYGNIRNAVHNSVQNTLNSISYDIYNFIFILRIDLYLKPLFIESFNPNWNKIMFMNAIHYLDNIKLPHISDPFIFIPKSYFFKNEWDGILANSQHLLYHQAVGELIKNGLLIQSIGFVTDRIYTTNTGQNRNPYFRLNGRPEGPEIPNNLLKRKYNHDRIEFIDDI